MTPKIAAYITKALRRVWGWSPEKRAARERANVGKDMYVCAGCALVFTRKETAVDHVEPVIAPELGFVDWNTFIERLFCQETGLQILCKATCHKKKTLVENGIRPVARRARKGAKNAG